MKIIGYFKKELALVEKPIMMLMTICLGLIIQSSSFMYFSSHQNPVLSAVCTFGTVLVATLFIYQKDKPAFAQYIFTGILIILSIFALEKSFFEGLKAQNLLYSNGVGNFNSTFYFCYGFLLISLKHSCLFVSFLVALLYPKIKNIFAFLKV